MSREVVQAGAQDDLLAACPDCRAPEGARCVTGRGHGGKTARTHARRVMASQAIAQYLSAHGLRDTSRALAAAERRAQHAEGEAFAAAWDAAVALAEAETLREEIVRLRAGKPAQHRVMLSAARVGDVVTSIVLAGGHLLDQPDRPRVLATRDLGGGAGIAVRVEWSGVSERWLYPQSVEAVIVERAEVTA